MECPVCGAAMTKARTHGVEIDACRDHGIWLDRGELERIVIDAKKSSGEAAAAVSAERRQRGRYEGIFLGWLSIFLPK